MRLYDHMRGALGLILFVLVCGCASTSATPLSQAPPNYALTWVKADISYEPFVADVDECNLRAGEAGRATPTRGGDPANDLSPPIVVWRWLEYGADVSAAMAQAYENCLTPRGYALAYVTAADARRFAEIAAAPIVTDESPDARWMRMRDAQLHLLYGFATAPRPLRARIEVRLQQRPLFSYVPPPGAP